MIGSVKFQFTKFTDVQKNGKLGNETYGYRVFDEYDQYSNDDLTLRELMEIDSEQAVLIIEDEYDELYEIILDNGFYFNNEWVAVDETGIVIREEE